MPDESPPPEPSPNASPVELPTARYSLRRFLGFITFSCLLLAVLVAVNGQMRIALLGSLVVIGGHVLATMLGSRLRAAANDRNHSIS